MITFFDYELPKKLIPGDILPFKLLLPLSEDKMLLESSILTKNSSTDKIRFLNQRIKAGKFYYYFEQVGSKSPEFYLELLKKYYDPKIENSFYIECFSKIELIDKFDPILFIKFFQEHQDYYNFCVRFLYNSPYKFWLSYLILNLLEISYKKVLPPVFETLFRGVVFQDYDFENILKSRIIPDIGITSWSLSFEVAERYSKYSEYRSTTGQRVILNLKNSGGLRCICRKARLKEVYLPMFSRLKVLGFTQERDTIYLDCEQA